MKRTLVLFVQTSSVGSCGKEILGAIHSCWSQVQPRLWPQRSRLMDLCVDLCVDLCAELLLFLKMKHVEVTVEVIASVQLL